jgi:transcriptional regulator GlxA family with amidase domain
MTSFSTLTTLINPEAPIRIALLHVEHGVTASGLNLAGLLAPLRWVEQHLGNARFRLDCYSAAQLDAADIDRNTDIALLVADGTDHPDHALVATLAQCCQQARVWGGVGPAVLWMACAGQMPGLRAALPWAMYAEVNDVAEHAILVPNLFELDGQCLTCCGGTASIDFALTLIHALFGADVQALAMEALCVDRVRDGDERQRIALHTRFGALQPQLSEAVTLMENNIEETLSTDDIAQLVGLSRRQLERQFKQYLGTMPSRYYLELRLKKARQLLLESNSSIVQIGLLCGFSSGAHFSTAFGAQFGFTPREERQRKLSSS